MSDPALDEAAELASGFEGFSAKPYLDMVAQPPVWTIGYGSTRDEHGRPVTANTPMVSPGQALDLMRAELGNALQAVVDDTTVPLDENQRAALTSFIYNIGIGGFEASTLLIRLNRGDYEGAAAEFEKWDHAGGRVVAGLLRRRIAERDLFLEPDQAAGVALGNNVVSTGGDPDPQIAETAAGPDAARDA